ncbi:hypothetical protein ACC678_37335, partial [Rhizobium ruizarguesonis]
GVDGYKAAEAAAAAAPGVVANISITAAGQFLENEDNATIIKEAFLNVYARENGFADIKTAPDVIKNAATKAFNDEIWFGGTAAQKL